MTDVYFRSISDRSGKEKQDVVDKFWPSSAWLPTHSNLHKELQVGENFMDH